jgi:hypothetical protein
MEEKTMKARVLHGIAILGLGALLFGATVATPAQAADWHRGRDRGGFALNIGIGSGPVNTDLVFYGGPDHRPAGPYWYWDRHDHCWRRDRCR